LKEVELAAVNLKRLHHDSRTQWPDGYPIPPGAIKVAQPRYAIMRGFEAGERIYARVIDSQSAEMEKFLRHQEFLLPADNEPERSSVRMSPLIYAMTGPSDHVSIFEQDVQRVAAQRTQQASEERDRLNIEWIKHIEQVIERIQQESAPALVSQLAITALQEGGRIERALSENGQVDVCGVWRSNLPAHSTSAEAQRENAFIKRLLLHWADPSSTDTISVVA